MILTIPAPGPWFTPNGRRHWAKTAQLVRLWRDAGYAAAVREQDGAAFYVPVVVTATVHKATRGIYDPPNLLGGSIKAAIDGALVDSGILPGDDRRFIYETRVRAGEVRKPAQLVLEVNPA